MSLASRRVRYLYDNFLHRRLSDRHNQAMAREDSRTSKDSPPFKSTSKTSKLLVVTIPRYMYSRLECRAENQCTSSNVAYGLAAAHGGTQESTGTTLTRW